MSSTPGKLKSGRRRSREIFERAERVLVGGVNSPVRAFRSVGGEPLIIERGKGSYLYDVDGNEFLDYVCSWGAMLLGHAHPAVCEAITDQAARGTSYGVTTELELELATLITEAIPFIEKIRFVSSGTEATMSALRLARGVTKRDFILKFEGCYHGHADSFLSQAGSGLATLGMASSPGVLQASTALTLNVRYNDLAAVEQSFERHRGQIAVVIVEPIAANMGVVPPTPGFLEGLRAITQKDGALLIFDEVISGFRVAYGGAQTLFKIQPDLTTLGKIIGGGLPVAAYGGRREIMQWIAPLGPVYQAGTLSGNPLAMRAGIETLRALSGGGIYEELDRKTKLLATGFREALEASGVSGQVNSAGSLLTVFFAEVPVRNYDDAKKSDTRRFAAFFNEMLERGVFLPPSQFEALFVSAAHSEQDIHRTVAACRESLHAVSAAAPA